MVGGRRKKEAGLPEGGGEGQVTAGHVLTFKRTGDLLYPY